MLMPSIFAESLFDEFMDEFEKDFNSNKKPRQNTNNYRGLMRTDVKENDNSYELDIDLPGFKKEDIKISFDNGYLNIAAKTSKSNEKDSNNKYIRQERFYGSMSRSFYVGEDVKKNEIRAKFEDGVLKLTVPKQTEKRVEQNNFISID
ncbi:MAG: Hsp20/alpha crystallin family protein [Erysipelotrichaceae bacterium]|nr:Hsp20/alpha crystallin family protein [Erysipelotrichaceae bacterium]